MRASILRRLLQCILLVLLTSGQRGVDGLDCYVGRDDNYRPLDCSIGVCRIVDCLCAKVVHTDGGVSRNDFHVEAVFCHVFKELVFCVWLSLALVRFG